MVGCTSNIYRSSLKSHMPTSATFVGPIGSTLVKVSRLSSIFDPSVLGVDTFYRGKGAW